MKDAEDPLTTEKVLQMLDSSEFKDPAKLGNVAGNLFNMMDKKIVDVDKVCPLPFYVLLCNITKMNRFYEKSFACLFSIHTVFLLNADWLNKTTTK